MRPEFDSRLPDMNIIFDFDGTICDSFDVAVELVKTNLPEKYYDPKITPEMARDIGLKGLIIKTKFPKRLLPKLIIVGRKEMAMRLPSLKAHPKMPQIIEKLSINNTLGIITSNSKDNVHQFLINTNLVKYFDFVNSELSIFGKHRKLLKVLKKYKLNPEDTYYVGDETRDIEAAKKSGIISVAVTWGYESENVVKKAKPDILITKVEQLLDLGK